MRLREKGKTDGEPISMGWDEAQAALAAGTHDVAYAAGSGSEKPREGKASDQSGDDLDARGKADPAKAVRKA